MTDANDDRDGGAFVEVRGLTKSYQPGRETVEVLRSIDLTIQRGELVAITGASGSGKTTLLNMIGGLDRDFDGSIAVDGTRLESLDDRALSDLRNRAMGFVFQSFHLLPHLNARENVAVPRAFAQHAARRDLQAPEELLRRVGLGDKVERFPSELSGGERQRVAVARALSCNPEMLLCDEPTGSLDAATGQGILDLLTELNEQRGVTVLLVTHEAPVRDIARRVVELADAGIASDRAIGS